MSTNRGVFGGGFLGMDNIGVFDRDQPLPTGGSLAQVDGTAWMGALVLQLLEITVELSHQEPGYLQMFGRWVWDAWLIANALEKGAGRVSFWDDDHRLLPRRHRAARRHRVDLAGVLDAGARSVVRVHFHPVSLGRGGADHEAN